MKIGTVVRVNALAVRDYNIDEAKQIHKSVFWHSLQLERPSIGVVTGETVRFDGIYYPSSRGGEYGEEVEPAYLKPTKTNKVLLVRFARSLKELTVFERDVQVLDEPNFELPYR